MKQTILFLCIIVASSNLITNLYNSIVDAPSWASNIPASVETARNYFSITNPGILFRVSSPVGQVLALLTLILFWKSAPNVRIYLGAALVLYIMVDLFTFSYFYPRLAVIYGKVTDPEALRAAVAQWSNMNWVRSAMIAVGLFLSCFSLHKIYSV